MNGDRGKYIFTLKLTTSRIGNLDRLIQTLLNVMTIHTCMHAYIHTYVHNFTLLIPFSGRSLMYKKMEFRRRFDGVGFREGVLKLSQRLRKCRLKSFMPTTKSSRTAYKDMYYRQREQLTEASRIQDAKFEQVKVV